VTIGVRAGLPAVFRRLLAGTRGYLRTYTTVQEAVEVISKAH
jgi:hypothetical protein